MDTRIEPGTPDPRVRRYLTPAAIVWQSGGEAAPIGAENLLREGGPSCVLKHDGAAPGLLLDFGREIHGGIWLVNGMTPTHRPTPVRVRFGESVAEAMGEPNQDHAIHDQIIQVPWYGAAEFGNTGFRYVRIDLTEPGTQLDITALRAVFLYHDLEYKGAFHCNDDRLNRIWDTAAYTVHLCMQERLWDGIKRDRLVWIGDMHPETMVIATVFGDHPIVPASLDYVRDQTPLPRWMNGISSYSLWWVRIQACWYRFHGNRDYLEAQREYLGGLLRQLIAQMDENGRERMGDGRFLDWPSSQDQDAIHAGLHALLLMALREGAELCAVLGDDALRTECLDAAAKLAGYQPKLSRSKQAAALCGLAGLYTPAEVQRQVLAKDPLEGVSTFYGYYVLQARAAAGGYAGCLELIRRYWGGMLDCGATTFWEDFDLAWAKDSVPIDRLVPEGRKSIHADYGNYCYKGLRHSLCHGWAAGPAAWLSEHILGFQPAAPGCAKLRIAPHLAGLEFAEGRFPTPRGIVHVRHQAQADGSIATEYQAPDGIEIISGA